MLYLIWFHWMGCCDGVRVRVRVRCFVLNGRHKGHCAYGSVRVVRRFCRVRVKVRVRVRCFVVSRGHKGVLCVRQRCGWS